MNWFDKVLSKFGMGLAPVPQQTVQDSTGATVAATGPVGLASEVSDTEVAKRCREHAYVLTTDLPPLKTTDQWWEEETQKRRLREGSEKAYLWLSPFMPLQVAKLQQLQSAQERGPHGASTIARELRALVRERRKAKEHHVDLLRALYGACVLADVSASLAFEGAQPHAMARYVDINEVRAINIDYSTMGYQCIESLTKTDVKWLVHAFGEPVEHQSFDSLWPHIRRNAISRRCWGALRCANDASKALGQPETTMREWLDGLVRRNIGYYKEWEGRVAARQAYLSGLAIVLDAGWAATRAPFVVADLETTGLNIETDEVLEFAAVRVDPSGGVMAEFSSLVRTARPVPSFITKLTGIAQAEIDRDGRSLEDAMNAFADFVGSRPVFFHNALFDKRFVAKAASQVKHKFANPIHDTLPMARQAWPSLGTYKLATLAEHVGAPAPLHRALADAKAALAVLMAARAKVQPAAIEGVQTADR